MVTPSVKSGCNSQECKWSAGNFNAGNLKIFRDKYAKGSNYLVSYNIEKPYELTFNGIRVKVIGLKHIAEQFG